MAEERMIVPSELSDWDVLTQKEYIDLSRSRSVSGRLFRKHILNMGDLIHPKNGKKITIDDAFVLSVKKNFDEKVCDIVQVPLAGKNNEHTEDPLRNIGEVIDITREGEKVYAVIDVRDDSAADKLGRTILGASAMLSLDYTDSRTGQKAGPTLLHVCGTNRPYVLGLEDYEEIVAASADNEDSEVAVFTTADPVDADVKDAEEVIEVDAPLNASVDKEDSDVAVFATAETKEPEIMPMTLKELLVALKEEHAIDVEALQSEVGNLKATAEAVPSLQEQLDSQVETIKSLKEQTEEIASLREQVSSLSGQAKLSNTLTKALQEAGIVELSVEDETITEDDIVGAVAELAHNHVEQRDTVVSLTARLESLELDKKRLEEAGAAARVDSLVEDGYVLPTQREVMVKLCLEDPDSFEALLPDQPYIKMSNEKGTTPPEDKNHKNDIDSEINRIIAGEGARYVTGK